MGRHLLQALLVRSVRDEAFDCVKPSTSSFVKMPDYVRWFNPGTEVQVNGDQVNESNDPRHLLARRLRELREECWPHTKVTQAQLALALGGVSVPLISSWESTSKPKLPPLHRLEAYATFFASARSMDGDEPRLLGPAELTDSERETKEELGKELLRLRAAAMGPSTASVVPVPSLPRTEEAENIASLNSGYLRFVDGKPITIICAKIPADMLAKIPYSNPADPDYVALYKFADLDAFIELHGHIRAANPGSQVNFRTADELVADDYTTHMVSLGGVDWNYATQSVFNLLSLPVVQVADWDSPGGQYFEVPGDGGLDQYRPLLTQSDGKKVLREDVAMLARAVNPFNRLRTVTICSGMYAGGTLGAVRALTDARFRDRNTRYARDRFGQCEAFCILTKVHIERGVPVTPDWTRPEHRLFEWASET